MTTIFSRESNQSVNEPGTHVLIIGVGEYPHLLGGIDGGQAKKDIMGLKQIPSATISAKKLANYFVGCQSKTTGEIGFFNPDVPLATVELLVSPPSDKEEEPTRENIDNAYEIWMERVKENTRNIGIFYFCGHGVTGLNDYLLPSDYGKGSNTWAKVIDINNTARAVRRCTEASFYFFIDACRECMIETQSIGGRPNALSNFNLKENVRSFSHLFIQAADEGQRAFGTNHEASRFTSALIQALSGYRAEAVEDENVWVVTSRTLCRSIERIIEEENKKLEPKHQQHIVVKRIGSSPIHYEKEQPKIVARRAPITYVNSHVRELLEAMLGAETLSPMVKETIAERVECGQIKEDQLQKEVDIWVRDCEQWARRLAVEPDREVVKQVQTLLDAGKFNEVGMLYDQLIQAAEARKDAEYVLLTSYYAGRASALVFEGKWRKAVPYYEKAIANAENACIDTHQLDLALILNNLGVTWHKLGEYEKAIKFYTRALGIHKIIYGDTPHPNVASDLSNLGVAWSDLGNTHKAIKNLKMALKINQKIYGDTPHPNVARELTILGLIRHKLGEYEKAIKFYTLALKIDQQIYGETPHPNVARDLNNLGVSSSDLGEAKKAIGYFSKALDIDQKIYGDTPHPNVANDLRCLGRARSQLSEYKEAIDLYTRALKIDQKVYGDTPHPDVALDLTQLGIVCSYICDYTKAIDYLKQALTILVASQPRDHPDIQGVRSFLSQVQVAHDNATKS